MGWFCNGKETKESMAADNTLHKEELRLEKERIDSVCKEVDVWRSKIPVGQTFWFLGKPALVVEIHTDFHSVMATVAFRGVHGGVDNTKFPVEVVAKQFEADLKGVD